MRELSHGPDGKAFDQFYEMYEGQIDAGVEAYCKAFGRKKDELTDEENEFVLKNVIDVLNEEFIKVLMLGQQVPDYDISAQIRTHEDFNKSAM